MLSTGNDRRMMMNLLLWVGGYSGSGVKICNRPRPRHPVGSISEVSIGIPIFIMYSPDCREKNRLNINI